VKFKTVMGLTGATAASLVGLGGLAAAPAGANAAVQVRADQLTTYLAAIYGNPFPGLPVFPPPPTPTFTQAGGFPNVKVSGNCDAVSGLFKDNFALNFVSGNAHVYRGSSNDVFPFLPGGLNATGTAQLIDADTGNTLFVGPAHVWLGQNANANGQFYAGETVSFSGTATDGSDSTISFTVNPGEIHSVGSGKMGGWGQQNLNCDIVS
jgi:hypothetical protein